MHAPEASSWLRSRRPLPRPRLRLVCAPYAGAGATLFHGWSEALPADVELRAVQLPGRQDRLMHEPFTRVDAIVERLQAALRALPPAPAVLLGHSFGGLLAYALARCLQAAGTPARALIVGASRAPHRPRSRPPMHALPEAPFVTALHERYGTPWTLLENEELLPLILPSLRADFEALETYVHRSEPQLALPITVLHGRHDTTVTRDDAAAWRAATTAEVRVQELEAGHFFIDTHRDWVLAQIAPVLTSA